MSGRTVGVVAGVLALLAGASVPAQGGTPPGAFGLLEPVEAVVVNPNEDVTFTWEASADATTYVATIAADAALSDAVCAWDVGYVTSVTVPWLYAYLAYSSTYYWGVVASNADGDTDSTPLSRSFTTVADTFAPVILATSPAYGSEDVDPSASIRVYFNETINEASITGAVTVTGLGGDITGALSLDVGGRAITFTPYAKFEYETTYTVTVAATVTDLAGNAAGEACEFSFTTHDSLTNGWPAYTEGCTRGAACHAGTTAFLALAVLAAARRRRSQPGSDVPV